MAFKTQVVDLGDFDLDRFLSQQRLAMQAPKAAPKKKNNKGFWTDQISTGGGIGGALAGGAAGAAAGSVVPIVGTAAGGILGAILGGGLGSAGGEVAENAMTGDNLTKNVAREGIIGGVTSLPIGAGLKLAQAGIKGTTGVGKTGVKELIEQAGAKTVPGAAKKTATGAAKSSVPLKTSVIGKLQASGDKALLSQYQTIPKKVADETKPLDVVRELASMGFTKPSDVERVAGAVTGPSGILNRQVIKATGDARNVDTSSLRSVFNDALDTAGVVDADRKSAQTFLEAQLKVLNGGARGSLDPLANPSDALQVMKKLEGRISTLRRTSGTVPGRADQADALQLVKDELQDKLYEGAGANSNLQKLLTPELRQELVGLAPDNAKWVGHVDDNIMTAKDVGSIRSAQRPLARGNMIIEAGDQNAITFGGRGGQAFQGGGIKSAIMESLQNVAKNPAARVYSAATRALPDGAQTVAGASTRANQALLPLAARQGAGRLATVDAPVPTEDPSVLPGTENMQFADAGMAEMDEMPQEPSIGGVTKSQLEEAMTRAAMHPQGQEALASLKTLYAMLPDSGSPELSAAGQKAMMSASNGDNTLNQIEQTIAQAGGGKGKVGGSVQEFMASIGQDKNAQLYRDSTGGWLNSISQALGKTDAPSESELAGLRSNLPLLTDPPEIVQQKIAMLRQRIASARQAAQYGVGSSEPTL